MKARFAPWGIFLLLAACKPQYSATRQNARPESGSSSVHFVDHIAITPGRPATDHSGEAPATISGKTYLPAPAGPGNLENYADLQFKYAILENAPVEDMTNVKLLLFMNEWYGTEYHYGGSTKDGIDCSAFVCLLMSTVYNLPHLPRVSKDQYLQSTRIDRADLREGDLVFFHTSGRRKTVTHVGVYLRNNKFIHASVSGVMISDLNEPYYAARYVGAGRYTT